MVALSDLVKGSISINVILAVAEVASELFNVHSVVVDLIVERSCNVSTMEYLSQMILITREASDVIRAVFKLTDCQRL